MPVTFKLDLGSGGAVSKTIKRDVGPGGILVEPIDPAGAIDTVFKTSDISGLPKTLVLGGNVSDPAMFTATAEADAPNHGELTTLGGGCPRRDYV